MGDRRRGQGQSDCTARAEGEPLFSNYISVPLTHTSTFQCLSAQHFLAFLLCTLPLPLPFFASAMPPSALPVICATLDCSRIEDREAPRCWSAYFFMGGIGRVSAL